LGDLKARIADEIARSDLTSQIALAIVDAIDEAATHRFWFNEVRGVTFPIIAGQEYYGNEDLDAMVEIDDLWLSVSGQRRNLRLTSDARIDELSNGTPPIGEPYCWSRNGNGLRLYPVPNLPYTVTIDGSTKFTPMENDTDWNGWTTQGERYIRALAKRNLYAEVIRDSDQAQVQDALATRYRSDLSAATYDRVASGGMRANG
jgi:hypothetical protein